MYTSYIGSDTAYFYIMERLNLSTRKYQIGVKDSFVGGLYWYKEAELFSQDPDKGQFKRTYYASETIDENDEGKLQFIDKLKAFTFKEKLGDIEFT